MGYSIISTNTLQKLINQVNEYDYIKTHNICINDECACNGLSPEIIDVRFSDPATIVFWKDGTKTIVKCQEGDKFDPEKGIALCYMKKILGNNSSFNEILKTYVEDESRYQWGNSRAMHIINRMMKTNKSKER